MWQPVDVTQCGAKALMTQQALQLVDRHAGFQLMGRVGVPQRMQTALLGNPGRTLGPQVGLLHRTCAEGRLRIRTVKQQVHRSIAQPVAT